MNTPDFLQQVRVSEKRRRADAQAVSRYSGPSSSFVWALLDLGTALVAGLIALRIRGEGVPVPRGEILLQLTHSGAVVSLVYLAAFGVFMVLFSRVYGLYAPAQNRSGLHEQRMTVQASLTAGLLLCGMLYLMRG